MLLFGGESHPTVADSPAAGWLPKKTRMSSKSVAGGKVLSTFKAEKETVNVAPFRKPNLCLLLSTFQSKSEDASLTFNRKEEESFVSSRGSLSSFIVDSVILSIGSVSLTADVPKFIEKPILILWNPETKRGPAQQKEGT